jgi:ferredoxin
MKVGGGIKECQYGCVGLGSCAKACPFGAIEIISGVAVVHSDKCRACKKCVAACPKKLISIIPYTADVFVSCSSVERGDKLRQVCNIGCLGCHICEKACPSKAITVVDNLAKIDYDKCTHCRKCMSVCPRKLIINASEVTSETSRELA